MTTARSSTITNTANVTDNAIVYDRHSESQVGQWPIDRHLPTSPIVKQPNFQGTSEPFSHVTLFEDPLDGWERPCSFGQTQARQRRQVEASPRSWPWPMVAYTITASAFRSIWRDDDGHLRRPITPTLLIDTVGPQITGLVFQPAQRACGLHDQRHGYRA